MSLKYIYIGIMKPYVIILRCLTFMKYRQTQTIKQQKNTSF